MIEEYHFGTIKISGKTYHHDVEVRWTGEVLSWWRKEGHVFDVDDVKRAVEQSPEIVILGTGASGLAKVTQATQEFITGNGIKLIIDRTEEAVKTFNVIIGKSEEETGKQTKAIGLFHLTC